MPTLNGTLLTANGDLVASAFFGLSAYTSTGAVRSVAEAILNIAVLVACAALSLLALDRFLAWQARAA
ncbi:MAG: hypothetical protein ACUVX9_17645 [Anaerolineae bacterium]